MVKYVRSRFFLLGLLLAVAVGSMAATVSYFGAGATDQLGVSLATLISGEDQTNSVLRVEGQFSYKPIPHADTQVKATAGFIHTVTCSSDAAATAGTIDIRDGIAAGGGTLIQTLTYTTNNYPPATLTLDVVTTSGIYMDYTTTADVDCVVSYR